MNQLDSDSLLFELIIKVADERFLIIQSDRVCKSRIIDRISCRGIPQAKFKFGTNGLS
jgi:hypothetical protein